jgi:hypothetical protein
MRVDKKPVIRLVRNKDGRLQAVDDDQNSQLKELWARQSATLEITAPSMKDDLKTLVKNIKAPKTANKINQKNNLKNSKISTNQNIKHTKTTNNTTHTIAITVPSLKVPSRLSLKILPKKYIIAGTIALISIAIVLVFWPNNKPADTISSDGGTNNPQVAGDITYKVNPDYAIMSPDGKGVDDLGGYALITPQNEPNKAYAYADKINGIPIKVSQQKLPDSIKQDALKLQDLASQFNANDKIEVDDRTAFVGTSVNGPQSVIFAREDIMVLIASDAKIPNQDWVKYLGNLRF